MEVLVRGLAIFIEWLILAGVLYFMLLGVQLILADIGVRPKYMKGLSLALAVVGSLVAVFLIAHLTTFYPGQV